jgi:hypothetical protein
MYLLRRPSDISIFADLEKEAFFNFVRRDLHSAGSVVLAAEFWCTFAIRTLVISTFVRNFVVSSSFTFKFLVCEAWTQARLYPTLCAGHSIGQRSHLPMREHARVWG